MNESEERSRGDLGAVARLFGKLASQLEAVPGRKPTQPPPQEALKRF